MGRGSSAARWSIEGLQSGAHAAGLRCRPLRETVADTWAWLSALGGPPPPRDDRPALGLPRERERQLLARAPR